jgi:thiaminase (transcriptional activator TenA)
VQAVGVRGERAGFTGELWRAIEPIFAAILAHPFLTGLTDGTLPRDRFQHYAVQDALYLRDFARTLSLAGARSPDAAVLTMFASHVVDTMTAEGALHDTIFAELGLTREQVEQTAQAPTTMAYTSYLLRVASLGDYAEVLGVALPCYWIYQEVGRVLLARGSPDPMYRRWIETYGGEEYAAVVDAVLAEVDRVGAGLTAEQRAAVREIFVTTSRYEWMFWDMGWRLEGWPI